jgi:hypothetical protein
MADFDYASPKTWPRAARRVFLLTAPVSIPLWWLSFLALFIWTFLAAIVALPFMLAWTAYDKVRELWVAP